MVSIDCNHCRSRGLLSFGVSGKGMTEAWPRLARERKIAVRPRIEPCFVRYLVGPKLHNGGGAEALVKDIQVHDLKILAIPDVLAALASVDH